MTLVEPDYVVQRFREGSKLDRPGFEENRRVRQELKPANPYVMLSILPEDLDFELNIIATDHFGAAQEVEGLAALAVVAHGQMAQGVTAIFFKYFPLFKYYYYIRFFFSADKTRGTWAPGP